MSIILQNAYKNNIIIDNYKNDLFKTDFVLKKRKNYVLNKHELMQ